VQYRRKKFTFAMSCSDESLFADSNDADSHFTDTSRYIESLLKFSAVKSRFSEVLHHSISLQCFS